MLLTYLCFQIGKVMLHQLFNKLLFPERHKIYLIINDIDHFYECIKKNGEITGQGLFKNNYCTDYWNYLNYYNWLAPDRQDLLITGILNIILFLAHYYLESDGAILPGYYQAINSSLDRFSPGTEKHERLYYMVKEALIIVWKKMNDFTYDRKRNNVYQSISWTLKHTILTRTPNEIKIINQR
jgi:hypothetical protein